MEFSLKTLTLVIFILLACATGKGQNACFVKLADAQIMFESGQIEEIPSLLDSCLHNGFTRDEKIQAYRLLIQVYLFDYNPTKANEVMSQMLREIKFYKIQPNDPIEFIELYNTYKLYPTWGIGITAQANLPNINIIKSYSLASIDIADKRYTPDEPGWSAGVSFNRFLFNKFWISGNINYSNVKYTTQEWLNSKHTESLTFKEQSEWLSIPLIFNYGILNKTTSPFLFAGAEGSYLLNAKSQLQSNISDYNNSVANTTGTRNRINLSALAGIGLCIKSTSGLFQIAAGYDYSFTPFTRKDTRFNDIGNILHEQHLDDNFILNKVFLSFSYSHLYYRIKKKQAK